MELYEKTLGILGFGRIGQLVAQRARGFGMRVLAFDAFVAEERFRELGAERADTSDQVYAEADFITVHLPKTPETENWLDAEAFAKMKDGVRMLNVARGPLVVDEDLQGRARLRQGRRRGARRVPRGAGHRSSAVRLSQRDRHARTWAPRPPRPPTAPATRPPSRSWPRSPAAW